MIFKVRRFDASSGKVRYDHFDVRPKPGMTVLSALFYIQDRIDDSLSFRYSCRGAVCGTCAVLINRVPRLACRTQAAAILEGTAPPAEPLKPGPSEPFSEPWKRRDEILIEPLPYLHTIKDLVVDMRKFFQVYRTVEPALRAPEGLPDKELRLEPAAVRELEKYSNCILCAACSNACPVVGKNPNYIGPAALAKLYRFAIDPREDRDQARLTLADNPDGWWACEFYNNCRRVCPKGVPPNLAIGAARRRLQELAGASAKAADLTPATSVAGPAAPVEITEPSAPLPERGGTAAPISAEPPPIAVPETAIATPPAAEMAPSPAADIGVPGPERPPVAQPAPTPIAAKPPPSSYRRHGSSTLRQRPRSSQRRGTRWSQHRRSRGPSGQ